MSGHKLDVNKELKFFVKIQKRNWGGGGGRGEGGVGLGGQGGCDRRIFWENSQKKLGGSVWGVGVRGGGGGVRVDVNEELKFL